MGGMSGGSGGGNGIKASKAMTPAEALTAYDPRTLLAGKMAASEGNDRYKASPVESELNKPIIPPVKATTQDKLGS